MRKNEIMKAKELDVQRSFVKSGKVHDLTTTNS